MIDYYPIKEFFTFPLAIVACVTIIIYISIALLNKEQPRESGGIVILGGLTFYLIFSFIIAVIFKTKQDDRFLNINLDLTFLFALVSFSLPIIIQSLFGLSLIMLNRVPGPILFIQSLNRANRFLISLTLAIAFCMPLIFTRTI